MWRWDLAEVDPVSIPPVLTVSNDQSPEALRADIEHLKWIIFQLRERTGGGNDAIAELQTGELYEPGIQAIDEDEIIVPEDPIENDHEERIEALENDFKVGGDLSERVRDLETDFETWAKPEDEEVTTEDFYAEVRKGNIPGHSVIHKFGRNSSVPNGSWAFVTNLGQTAHVLSAATTVRVKAGNAADDTAGNGAREVTVEGIVATTFAEESEAIATAGGSASSATTKSFWRVHRAWVSSVGVYGAANTAAVVIEDSGGSNDILTIATEEGQSQDAVWSVPYGHTGYILSVHVTVDGNKAADIRVFTRDDIDDTSAPMKSKRLKKFFDGMLGSFVYKPVGPNSTLNAKSDVWVEAQGSGAGTEVSADIEILLVQDGF